MATAAELLHRDAPQRAAAFVGLSKAYTNAGDSWMALQAQMAADLICVSESLSRRQDKEEIWAAVQSKLSAGSDITRTHSARETAEAFRKELASVLPADVTPTLVGLLSHLSNKNDMDPGLAMAIAEARTQGSDFATHIKSCLKVRDDRASAALEASKKGAEWQAVEAQYESDLAAFDAWVTSRCAQTGDNHLIWAQLRWALVTEALEQMGGLPDTVEESKKWVRSRLTWAVGPAEMPYLAATFKN